MVSAWGVYSVLRTPLDALPDLSDVQVIIRTTWPGQAPRLVENQVTYPLTTTMLSVPGAKTVRGYSFFGDSFVYVLFEDGTDLYWARSRVVEVLNQVQSRLPPAAKAAIGPDATGVGWIYQYALIDRSGTMDAGQLRALQDWFLKYELKTVPDVAEVASIHELLGPPALAVLVLLVIVGTLALCARRGRLAAGMPSRLLALSLPWLLLPPAVLLAASAVHPVYAPRYIMFCAPAAALLAGAGLASLGWAGGAAGLALIVLVALPGQAEDRRVGSHSEDLRQLSRLVAAHSRPGDALLFPRLNDREFEAAYPAPYRRLRDVTLAPLPTQSATLLGTPATSQAIRHRLATADRLWVIETGTQRGNLPLLTGLGFRQSHRWTVTGIWLVLYTRPG